MKLVQVDRPPEEVRMCLSRRILLVVVFLFCAPSNQVPSCSQQLHLSAQKTQIASSSLFVSGTPTITNLDAPRIIPLSALERYQEGAELRLFCSASAPPNSGRLHFEWRKNFAELLPEVTGKTSGSRIQASLVDDWASSLRISQLEASDSANYTCLARNQHGFDSSTVRVNVNVRFKWIVEPPSEVQAQAGKSLQLECDASGQPTPLISWTNLKDRQTIMSKILRIDRLEPSDSGLYECKASSFISNRPQTQQTLDNLDQLKKIVKLVVHVFILFIKICFYFLL